MKLYCDDFVLGEGFATTEDYVLSRLENGRCLRFRGSGYYYDLLENDLIREGDVVVGFGRKKFRRCYEVLECGNLINLLWRVYPLDKKVYFPDEVFCRKRIGRDWFVSGFAQFRERFNIREFVLRQSRK